MRGRFFPTFKTGLAGPVVVGAGLLLLAFSPAIRGGNRRVALILLEALALLLLLLLLVLGAKLRSSTATRRPVSITVLLLAGSPLWVGIVQLVPIPPFVWASLPGHDVYVQALSAVQVPVNTWRPISLVPDATWLSVLAGLPLAASFLLGHVVSSRQLRFLLRAIVLFTVPQAILGLLQVSLFRQLYFDAAAYGRAIGTFANPNHLASYIAMTLPLTILVLRQALQADPVRGNGSRPQRAPRSGGGGNEPRMGAAVMPALWGAVLFVQLAALLATVSRAGLAVGALAALAATLLLPLKALSRRAWWRRVAGACALCVLVAATVGVDGLLSRVAGSGREDTRWALISGTWQAALAFWPFGSGLGSYAGVFPRFQPAGLSGFADFAHSDFLQLLMECGLLFVILAGVVVWLVAKRALDVARRLRENPSNVSAALLASCGLGFSAVMLHSLVDFNLRIPATAMLALFLMGAFLRPLASETQVGNPAPGH